MHLLICFVSLGQEVAVKEQLMGKGKLCRRSLSSPNVNRVSVHPTCSGLRAAGPFFGLQVPVMPDHGGEQ